MHLLALVRCFSSWSLFWTWIVPRPKRLIFLHGFIYSIRVSRTNCERLPVLSRSGIVMQASICRADHIDYHSTDSLRAVIGFLIFLLVLNGIHFMNYSPLESLNWPSHDDVSSSYYSAMDPVPHNYGLCKSMTWCMYNKCCTGVSVMVWGKGHLRNRWASFREIMHLIKSLTVQKTFFLKKKISEQIDQSFHVNISNHETSKVWRNHKFIL